MTRRAREAALDVLAAWAVWGAPEWAADGDASHLARPWRVALVQAAERIGRRYAA